MIVARLPRLRSRTFLAAASGLVFLGVVALGIASHRQAPDVPLVDVIRREFVDVVELRGEVRPMASKVLAAPMLAGDLQIIRLAKANSQVKAGDVVVEFDPTTLRRTRQERLSELRQADAEIDQARADARIVDEESRTALMKARFDVDRAALDVVEGDTVARLDYERAKLALDDARQRLRETEAKNHADRAANAANLAARQRRREKVQADLERTERGLAGLQLRAPSAGMVNLLPNFRTSGPMGAGQEFREGDRAWSGAGILELPDLASVNIAARLEEIDRGRVTPGQAATLRVDAVPDREYRGTVTAISLLARADFTAGWPPPRDFDVTITIEDADARLRPGMTASVRVAVDRLANVLVIPAEAVSQVDGRPTVYRLAGSRFEPVVVTLARRGREQVVVLAGVGAGDRLAATPPPADTIRGGR
ncbi:MAG: efflux RND transporter periplasmic adaptor subunit [Vicinamibacterales bacterium]|nr:efflux RND transporter periplasmic adaptor subunit [Vicinamibacterales bacterium]